jgi:hypothetical protein
MQTKVNNGVRLAKLEFLTGRRGKRGQATFVYSALFSFLWGSRI